MHRDRDVEGDALLRVRDRVLEGSLRDSHSPGGGSRPREVEGLHRDLEPLALLAQPILDGYDDVCERERGGVGRALPHLVQVLLDLHARGVHRHDKGRDAAMTLAGIGLCEDDGPRGVARVRDEGLRAVQDVRVALPHCGRLHARDIGPGVRLAQAERAEDRLFEERWKPLLLLLLGAGDQDGRRAEAVRADGGADPGATAVQLLADEHAVEGREPDAAQRLGHVQVHQSELVCLRDDVDGVGRMLVVLGRLRPDLLVGELACERAELALLGRELERDAAGDTGLNCCHDLGSCVD